jgi:lambda family phage portal protein
LSLARRLRDAGRVLFTRNYNAASGGKNWPKVYDRWPAYAELRAPVRQALAARYPLAIRAAHQAANNPVAEAAVSTWIVNLIGDGPVVRSKHPSEPVRTALEQAWNRFYLRCDVEGVSDLAGLGASVVRSLVICGEAVVHMLTTGRGELRLHLLSPEQLDPTRNSESPRVIAGVEFGAMGERVAYHVLPNNPEIATTVTPIRVPADDILHVFEPRAPGMVRGVSWLTSALTRLVELDKVEDAIIARLHCAALFGGFLHREMGAAGLAESDRHAEGIENGLEPGVVVDLGESNITFPEVPSADVAPDFLKHMLHEIAAGIGLPYELVVGDLASVNYSSAKVGLENFKRRCCAIRASLLVAQFLRPVWERFVTLEILSGRLSAPDFEVASEDYLDASFLFPEWASLDPFKEAKADLLLLQAGLRSRFEIVSARGRDPEELNAEIAADPMQSSLGAIRLPSEVSNESA